jgi:SPP1 gp7 family putative phage head morphogenesis protein
MLRRLDFTNNARVDPTRTVSLRRRYEADMVRRFRELETVLRKAIGAEDVLGLETNKVAPPPHFDFRRDPEKVSAFIDWLRKSHQDGILELKRGTAQATARGAWQDIYIQSAYQKGLQQAASQMRKAGAQVEPSYVDAAFFRPVHADRVGLIYTRAFTDLKGVTDAMDAGISRVLAQGIAEGVGPMEMARRMVHRVEGIGIARARTLARTEVIGSHAVATLNSFKEAGIEGVNVLAEFTTAGDGKVCAECADLEGKTYSLEDAEGLIPVHPNCRCTFVPAVKDMRGVVLR